MENLEEKSLKTLLLSNKKILLSFSFILIILIAFFWWSESTSKKKRYINSENFIKAKVFISEDNNFESLKLLKNIIESKDEVYSTLALFLIIDRNLETNEANITKYFDQVLSIKSLEEEDKNLLKLKKAIYISENIEEKDILNLLNPVINSNSVWKYQTLKFLGDYYFSKKEFRKAKQYYSDILALESPNNNLSDINKKIKIIDNEKN